MRRRGFIMIIALVYALILSVIVMAMAFSIAYETRAAGFRLDSVKALYLAEAGIENKLRDVRDGRPLLELPPPLALGDGTVEYVSVDQPAPDALRINLLGNVGTGTSLSKVRVIATYRDDGNGRFLTCISWKENYE